MMGRLEGGADKLFYEFSLDEMVPTGHLLRKIDRFLDFDSIRAHLKPFYSHTGRPSVDPELMCRMLIVGYCYGIRSERRLCEEVHLNLAYRWFCRLGIEDQVPNHSTFSKARHGRFRESDLFRKLFEQVVTSCMIEGLVKGEGFAVDASMIRADASEDNAIERGTPIDWSDPKIASRPVAEYLDAIDQDGAPRKKISLTDPTARWTAAIGGQARFTWATNYLLDVETSVIVDVEATPAYRIAEVDAAKLMIDRTEDRFGLKPKRLMGDAAYGSAEILGWIVDEKGIAPHVSLMDIPGPPTANFTIKDFAYDKERDLYTCPGGKELRHQWRNYKVPRSGITKDKKRMYRSRNTDCSVCPLKPKCCPNAKAKRVGRHIYEHARDEVKRLRETPEYEQSRRDRKKVEMSFAHLKRLHGLRRLRLRGPTGARDEFLLAATAQNLRKLARYATPPAPNTKIAA
jgi:transposase